MEVWQRNYQKIDGLIFPDKYSENFRDHFFYHHGREWINQSSWNLVQNWKKNLSCGEFLWIPNVILKIYWDVQIT